MQLPRLALVAIILSLQVPLGLGHSWIEAVNRIAPNGSLVEPTGYNRNFIDRGSPYFKGNGVSNFQLSQGVTADDQMVCMPIQQKPEQNASYPRLQASPGDLIALRYIENGHVTIPTAATRSPKAGNVTVSSSSKITGEGLQLKDVMAWTADGHGGNGHGQLLVIQPFDDGRCYENNGSPKYVERHNLYPVTDQQAMNKYTVGKLPCQQNFQIPLDSPVGKPLAVFWVWNYTWIDSVQTPSKNEIYSNCLDIDIVAPASGTSGAGSPPAKFAVARNYDTTQSAASAAIPQYFSSLASNSTTAAVQASSVPQSQDTTTSQGQASMTPVSNAAQTLTSNQPLSEAASTAPVSLATLSSPAVTGAAFPSDASSSRPSVSPATSVPSNESLSTLQTQIPPPNPQASGTNNVYATVPGDQGPSKVTQPPSQAQIPVSTGLASAQIPQPPQLPMAAPSRDALQSIYSVLGQILSASGAQQGSTALSLSGSVSVLATPTPPLYATQNTTLLTVTSAQTASVAVRVSVSTEMVTVYATDTPGPSST